MIDKDEQIEVSNESNDVSDEEQLNQDNADDCMEVKEDDKPTGERLANHNGYKGETLTDVEAKHRTTDGDESEGDEEKDNELYGKDVESYEELRSLWIEKHWKEEMKRVHFWVNFNFSLAHNLQTQNILHHFVITFLQYIILWDKI